MKISRRSFTALSLATLGLPKVILGRPFRNRKPVAAVLEHTESYTRKTTGAAVMLEQAGFDVIRLAAADERPDLTPSNMVMNFEDEEATARIQARLKTPGHRFAVGPDKKQIDLLFFGTFANHGQAYHDYLRQYAAQIPAFVAAGGVVVEMTQWGRYSFLHPPFLPPGMELVWETWSNTDDVVVAVDNHPLVSPWAGPKGHALDFETQPHRPGRAHEAGRSWQSIAVWDGMQVLLSAGGGYKRSDGKHGRAAMVEGAHGKGRYVFSALWLDKLFDEAGKPVAREETMQVAASFFQTLKNYVALAAGRNLPPVKPTAALPEPWIGPMLGHNDHEKALVWARADSVGEFGLHLWKERDKPENARELFETANADNDLCLHWTVDKLEANTKYYYQIRKGKQVQFDGRTFSLQTAPSPDTSSRVVLVFGSCADQTGRFAELWDEIARCGAQGMVLLGDTPYIDSTVAIQQRIKHREFLTHPGPAKLSKAIPFWATWDDHDFGANSSDGRIHNRLGTRRVFSDYRALTHFGEDGEGIYNSFRRGPVEVFILDTRFFSGTEPSFADATKPTLLGSRQWKWLQSKLKASDAPFKILACGMTWDSKRTGPGIDGWQSYAYEREAIIDFVGANRIGGVVLVGGDIHCSQVMKYKTEDRVGYPLYHFVTSPMHNRVIREHENLSHDDMLFARAEPNSFLRVEADATAEPGLLTFDVMNAHGQSLYRVVTGEELNVSVRP